mmetsp:Transcript_48791/g.137335  ORF Transcript_48791/g.137335 Transcript_48791/m.137335 type:complete len:675 (-) Transcript_48791:655-2679(-)
MSSTANSTASSRVTWAVASARSANAPSSTTRMAPSGTALPVAGSASSRVIVATTASCDAPTPRATSHEPRAHEGRPPLLFPWQPRQSLHSPVVSTIVIPDSLLINTVSGAKTETINLVPGVMSLVQFWPEGDARCSKQTRPNGSQQQQPPPHGHPGAMVPHGQMHGQQQPQYPHGQMHLFTSNPQVPYGSLPPPPGQGLPGMPPHGQPHPQYGHPGMPPHGAAFGGQPHHPHTMPPHQPGHMQSMSGVPMAHHPHPSSHPHTMPPHHMGHPGYPGASPSQHPHMPMSMNGAPPPNYVTSGMPHPPHQPPPTYANVPPSSYGQAYASSSSLPAAASMMPPYGTAPSSGSPDTPTNSSAAPTTAANGVSTTPPTSNAAATEPNVKTDPVLEGEPAMTHTFSVNVSEHHVILPKCAVRLLADGRVTLHTTTPSSWPPQQRADPVLIVNNVQTGQAPEQPVATCVLTGRAVLQVRGAVKPGQLLVPSGMNDGCARVQSSNDVNTTLGRMQFLGTSLDEYTPPGGMDSKPGVVRVLVHPQEELAGPQSKEHGEGKAGAEPPEAQSPTAQPAPPTQPHLAYPSYPHPSGGSYGAPGMSAAMSLPMQMPPQRMPGLPVSAGVATDVPAGSPMNSLGQMAGVGPAYAPGPGAPAAYVMPAGTTTNPDTVDASDPSFPSQQPL